MQKSTQTNLMHILQFLLYLSLNNLFIAKYAGRITEHYPTLMIAYSALLTGFYLIYTNKTVFSKIEKNTTMCKVALYALIIIAISIAFVLYHLIDPQKLKIDRWIALSEFTQNLFAGNYPYSELSYGGGFASPFPVWQLIHIPFALMGNVNYVMIISILLLALFLIYFFENYTLVTLYLFLLVASPAFWYEIAGRSDLLYNFIICMMTIGILQKKGTRLSDHYKLIGLICGLFLSTRISTAIPFFILFFRDFSAMNIRKKLAFVAIITTTFCLTFLPLFWWGDKLFSYQYNPFVLQTRQGNSLSMIPVALFILLIAVKWKTVSHYFSWVAVSFIVMVTVSIVSKMIRQHFDDGLFSSTFDITYFSMSLPFILMSLVTYSTQNMSDKYKNSMKMPENLL